MGCCESNEERGNINMSSIPYSKSHKTGKSYRDEYRNDSFESEADTEIGADYDLYSDFSDDDSHSDNEESDWEDLTYQVSLERVGYSKPMFSK